MDWMEAYSTQYSTSLPLSKLQLKKSIGKLKYSLPPGPRESYLPIGPHPGRGRDAAKSIAYQARHFLREFDPRSNFLSLSHSAIDLHLHRNRSSSKSREWLIAPRTTLRGDLRTARSSETRPSSSLLGYKGCTESPRENSPTNSD